MFPFPLMHFNSCLHELLNTLRKGPDSPALFVNTLYATSNEKTNICTLIFWDSLKPLEVIIITRETKITATAEFSRQ